MAKTFHSESEETKTSKMERSDQEAIKSLKADILYKISLVSTAVMKLDDFVKCYEKSVTTGGKIFPRQAKSAAKALKEVTSHIAEYEAAYEEWLELVDMDDARLDSLDENHELYPMAPSRTGAKELEWNSKISRVKKAFAAY